MSGGAFGSAGLGSFSVTPVQASSTIVGDSSVGLVILVSATATAAGSAVVSAAATKLVNIIASMVGAASTSAIVESDTPVAVAMIASGFVVFDMTKVTVVRRGSTPQVPAFAKPFTVQTIRQVPPAIHPPVLSVGAGNTGARKRPSGL